MLICDSDLMKQAEQHAPLVLLSKPAELEPLERTIRMVLGDRMEARHRG